MSIQLAKRDNIYNVIQPYHKIMKYYGLASFTFVTESNGITVHTNWWDLFHLVKMVISSTVFVYYDNFFKFVENSGDTKIEDFGEKAMYVVEYVIFLFTFFINLKNQKKISQFINLLYEFDENVGISIASVLFSAFN